VSINSHVGPLVNAEAGEVGSDFELFQFRIPSGSNSLRTVEIAASTCFNTIESSG
jgi:hypothetical protein